MSTHRTLRRTHLSRTAAAAALVLALAACAGPADDEAADDTATETTAAATTEPATEPTTDTPTDPGTEATSEPAPEPATETPEPAGPSLDVTVAGGDIGPNAEEIDLGVGEELVIRFDADRAGELHVHSKPEQYVQFEAGRTEQTIVIETPGEVEVEEHDSGAVVALIQVS